MEEISSGNFQGITYIFKKCTYENERNMEDAVFDFESLNIALPVATYCTFLETGFPTSSVL